MDRYISIDEEGYWIFSGRRVDDVGLGGKLLENLTVDGEGRLVTDFEGQPAYVESFDAPLVARHVRKSGAGLGEMDLPYETKMRFPYRSLSIDEWDRFHGVSEKGVPFVFSRGAQVEFFDMLDEFEDDSVTIDGDKYPTPPWLEPFGDSNSSEFWTGIYQNEEPGWEQGRESVALPEVLPQLKLAKSRVLVLGSGSGNDAAYFAKLGHVVTAVDFSEEAVAQAKAKYGGLANLRFVKADIFELPKDWSGRYDVIFEHTCYCAITPERRDELVKNWKRLLAPGGHLLGVFFVHEKRRGPPFGGSEWELRERLKNDFDFLYWTRWHLSVEKRKGKELVVFARKKS
ncbi:MAG TPA: class I SAM-dependent methyltransferase [Bdellovibrionales bacterium]|nr:class I SAM-dependent methyltransferase [Bdellovibrionales bacterium]